MRRRLAAALKDAIVTPSATPTVTGAPKPRSSSNDSLGKGNTASSPPSGATPGTVVQNSTSTGGANNSAEMALANREGYGSGAPRTGGGNAPENFRVMFHVMTNDHKMPDLIWNEQTRLELRSAVEAELKEFDREQRLRGAAKIAWNYQQFSVVYPSLKDEMQVGPIYVRYFLDSNETFLRGLENPSHIVLFEKLFRRVLVNVEKNSRISTLCTRCLVRLYKVCSDQVGPFDDMMLTVRMLDQAKDMELQHCLLDLLEALAVTDMNLHQLLEREFVNCIIKFASLAHLNPDQIGNVLARATTNTLMLTNNSSGSTNTTDRSPSKGKNTNKDDINESTKITSSEDDDARQLKRSMWVPDDDACPKVWFVAPAGQNPPPANTQKGPFR